MKKLVFLLCILLLVGCTKNAEPAPVNETPVVNETVAAPQESFGRVVVAVGATGALSFDQFTLQLTDLELYNAAKDSWKKLTSAKTEFDLVMLQDKKQLFIDTPLDPAQYTKLRFRINNADAVKETTEYSVSVPYTTVTVDALMDVVVDKTTTAEIVIDGSVLTTFGEKGFLKPSVQVVTKTEADVTVDNTIVAVAGGTVATDEKNGVLDLYTEAQVASMMKNCGEDCVDACSSSTDNCQTECEDGVEAGCESEDEDICREHCESYLPLFDCRDGCQESSAAQCTDYLQDRCGAGCDDAFTECNVTCATSCR